MAHFTEVMVDCNKMKKPNTGLYSFCKNLVNALNNPENSGGAQVSMFAPESAFHLFQKDIPKKKMHAWHSFYLSLPREVKVWHETYQLGKYHPAGNQKRVLTIHDLNFLYERNRKGLKSGLKHLQKNVDNADVLVTISEYTKKDLLNYIEVSGKDVKVIYNGCENYTGPVVSPERTPVRPFLFSLGTILPKKNFHVLPCLLYKNDFDLIIAGNLSSYSEKIMAEATKWGVENRVHIIGPVDEPVKQWYLKNCEAFLFPSVAEGFGLPVVEAMFYGKPLFLSQHTCLPEVGGNAAVYFNTDFDSEDMQQEFNKGMELFRQPGRLDELRKRVSLFSWDQAARQYWTIYRSLLD